MTKIGVENSNKSTNKDLENGVAVVVQPPIPVKSSNVWCYKFTIAVLGVIAFGLLIGVISVSVKLRSLEHHHHHHHHHHHDGHHDESHSGESQENDGKPNKEQHHFNLPYNIPLDYVKVDPEVESAPYEKPPSFQGVKRQNNNTFTFDDMFDSTFSPKSPYAAWVGKTNKVYYFTSDLNLVLHNVDTNEVETVLDADMVILLEVSYVIMSEDERYLLIPYDTVSEIQDSFGASSYRIFDRQANISQAVLDFPNDDSMAGRKLLYGGWTGDDHSLSFVFENDLYTQEDPYSSPVRLTTSGANPGIRNGMTFWNFAGVLWDYPAHWFSDDMQYLAYGFFNSSSIVLSEHPVYGDYDRNYPYMFRQVYLKSGDAEHFSYGEIRLLDLSGDEAEQVLTFQPPQELRNKDHYFFAFDWVDNSHVMIGWCNRAQTDYYIEICSVPDGTCQRNREQSILNGWIRGQYTAWDRLIEDGSAYIAVISSEVGDQGRFQQVAYVTAPTDEEGTIEFLTSEAKEVLGIAGFDSDRNIVYYWATDGNQLTQHLYRVGTGSADIADQEAVCLTCPANNPVSQDCQYISTSFSYSTDYYILSCLGPDIPSYHLVWTYDDKYYTIEDNAALATALASKAMPTKQFVELDIGDGYKGWAELFLPPDMVTDGSVKYPVLFYPYAGPHGTTQANYAYKSNRGTSGGWETYLASSENIIGVRLNGRGSGSKGDEFLYQLYRQLGTKEIEDQIYGAQSMIEEFPYVDADKFAVWGWSYGGFTTTHILGHPSDTFKCGTAMAPVTNFRYYYSGYTERYMGLDTLTDNKAGYDATDATRKAANFANKKYLLAHGTLDDNVHVQNALQMGRALHEAQVVYNSIYYTDQNHLLPDSLSFRHLFLTMREFLLNQCFQLDV